MKKTIEIISKSGKLISLLIFESLKRPLFTFIDVHGSFAYSKELLMTDNKELLDYIKYKKWNYIAIDLSNNGTRTDQPINKLSFKDRIKDVQTVIEYSAKNYKSKIMLVGSSIGGFIVLNSVNKNIKNDIRGIILNCSAVSLHEHLLAGIDLKEFKNWKKRNLALVWGVPFKYSWYKEVKSLDVLRIIKKMKIPILWFHGELDEIVPMHYAEECSILNPNIILYKIKNGMHRFGKAMKKGEWIGAIKNFIEKKIINSY